LFHSPNYPIKSRSYQLKIHFPPGGKKKGGNCNPTGIFSPPTRPSFCLLLPPTPFIIYYPLPNLPPKGKEPAISSKSAEFNNGEFISPLGERRKGVSGMLKNQFITFA
jgi:hypothetical protein